VIDRTLQALCVLIVSTLLVCVMLGVITRALGDPLIWTDEAARLLMVWLASMGWMLALRRRVHIRIGFFQNLLPRRAWRVMEITIQLLIAGFGLRLAWFACNLVARNWTVEATSLPIPMSLIYLPLIVVGVATAAQGVWQAGEQIRGTALVKA
jgi:TRAP-type C4-dicarboxylate transport system permease small subunit